MQPAGDELEAIVRLHERDTHMAGPGRPVGVTRGDKDAAVSGEPPRQRPRRVRFAGPAMWLETLRNSYTQVERTLVQTGVDAALAQDLCEALEPGEVDRSLSLDM